MYLFLLGNWPNIAYKKASGVSVSVSETTAGRSDGRTATLRLAGVDSPPIDNSMSAQTVRVYSHREKANALVTQLPKYVSIISFTVEICIKYKIGF